MSELDRKAMARDVLNRATVEMAYAAPGTSLLAKRFCESHERLRMEVEGFEAMRDGVEVRIADLHKEIERLRMENERLRAVVAEIGGTK